MQKDTGLSIAPIDVDSKNQTLSVERNLNFFSDKLASELEGLLASLCNAKPTETELQEIGRHIMQFVLVRENAHCVEGAI